MPNQLLDREQLEQSLHATGLERDAARHQSRQMKAALAAAMLLALSLTAAISDTEMHSVATIWTWRN
jgi:hypothetical protein